MFKDEVPGRLAGSGVSHTGELADPRACQWHADSLYLRHSGMPILCTAGSPGGRICDALSVLGWDMMSWDGAVGDECRLRELCQPLLTWPNASGSLTS